MSSEELSPFVAAVIRDNIMPELVAENKALRAELKDERHARRLVEIVGKDRTVFAAGTLEGANLVEPASDSLAPGTINVTMKMVEGVRTCKKPDLDGLMVRIGGINAYTLDGEHAQAAPVRDFSFIGPVVNRGNKYFLFLVWPTKLYLALLLSFTPDEDFYPLSLDGRRLELDGISFECGPRIANRDAVDGRGGLALGNEEVKEIIFRGVMFASFVGEGSSTFGFFAASPHLRELAHNENNENA